MVAIAKFMVAIAKFMVAITKFVYYILEHDVKKLGTTWRENIGKERKYVATVTITWDSHSVKYSSESIKIVL